MELELRHLELRHLREWELTLPLYLYWCDYIFLTTSSWLQACAEDEEEDEEEVEET